MEALPKGADAAGLTEALRRCGVLGDGRVREVAIESSRATVLSRIIRLRLAYDGAAARAPRFVILKTALPERAEAPWDAGRQEVAFYAQVAAATSTRHFPLCFDSACNAEARTWHLVLEDLTDTHLIATPWPLPPTAEQCEGIVRAKARFHAEWWDDPRLGTSVGTWLDAGGIDRNLKAFWARFIQFADRVGDLLSFERRALYERLMDAAPKLVERYHSHRNITVVQGDSHVWNCFLPQDGSSDIVRFFDWDWWRIDPGSDDLAYMMALNWYPDYRRRLERRLLDQYHESLVAHGVRSYDRRALDDDYRLSVLWQITTPVRQAAYGIPPVIWWNNLERVMLAVDDLRCSELLG